MLLLLAVITYAARQADPHLARANRDAWKKIHRGVRARMRLESGE